MNKVLRFSFLIEFWKVAGRHIPGKDYFKIELRQMLFICPICSDTKSNFMLLVVYSGESNFIVPRHFSWNKCVNCQIWVLQFISISFIRSLPRLCLESEWFLLSCWLSWLTDMSLCLYAFSCFLKNTVLSICLHLSNLDCDRTREHGISPISLSLESCFVKHNCKKDPLTDWSIPRHFKMIVVKEIWFEFISNFPLILIYSS